MGEKIKLVLFLLKIGLMQIFGVYSLLTLIISQVRTFVNGKQK